jgi:2-polyprenyl-6-methoxyphenol hydroxylase-like FAD-dependent oxidoreductase
MLMHSDVVVVGAGIGGAVLALELGRRGWRVTLLERESAPTVIARPEILWGPTLDALDALGVGALIRRDASVELEGADLGGGEKPWVRITREDYAAAGAYPFSTNPTRTRAIVAEAAVATGGVEIFRGVAARELLLRDGRVNGVRGVRGLEPVEIQARLVVGDDGGNSIVRAQLGIPIALQSFPVEFITALVPRWPLPPHRVRGWIDFGADEGVAAVVLFPWPGDEGALLLPLPATRVARVFEQTPEAFWGAVARVTPIADALRERLRFPADFRRVQRPFGHVSTYVADGAALIGDAAHPMTPAGGQGANASIWDALALADVADRALRDGDVSGECLAPYERLRRPINDRSVSFSRLARRLFGVGRFLPSGFVPLIPRTIDALRWPKRRILRMFATAFVHSRG